MQHENFITQQCGKLIYSSPRDSTCGVTTGTGLGCCDCCHKCIQCENATCMDSIPGCEAFYSAAFAECTEEEEEKDHWIWYVIGAVLLSIFPCAAIGLCWEKRSVMAQRMRACWRCECKLRLRAPPPAPIADPPWMQKFAFARGKIALGNNSVGALRLELFGTYTERVGAVSETKPTTYTLNVEADGRVTGNSKDDDGTADVEGKLEWSPGAPSGKISWRETYSFSPGNTLEAVGVFSQIEAADGDASWTIDAQYVSVQGVQGKTKVQSRPISSAQHSVAEGTVVKPKPDMTTEPKQKEGPVMMEV